MTQLFRLSGAVHRDPEVEAWLCDPNDELRRIARIWFEKMRGCGADVGELLHDGGPVACVEDAAFGYVNSFKAHVNVGFFQGAALDDPTGLLEGSGKRMRHVRVRWGEPVDGDALGDLIAAAYLDIHERLRSPEA